VRRAPRPVRRHSALLHRPEPLRHPEQWDDQRELRLAARAQPVEPVQPGSAAWQGFVGCAPAACRQARHWVQPMALCRRAARPAVPRDALRAAGCRRVRRWAQLTGLHQQVAYLLAHPDVPHAALHAVAHPRAVSVFGALPRAGCAAGQPQAAESSDAREPRAEPAALEAQHAAAAQEAAGAQLDAGAQEAVRAAALPDAEPVGEAEQLASPVVGPERPWPAAVHPSAALPFPFRAPWLHPRAAAAPPPWVRFAHARQNLQIASQ
jgi:hypothetical protein